MLQHNLIYSARAIDTG